MNDRDEVIKGLESLREMIRTARKYTFTSGGICAMSMGIIDDAIAMLKADRLCEAALDSLVDMELTYICDDMAPCDWCEEHCKPGQTCPDRECWEHYLRGE